MADLKVTAFPAATVIDPATALVPIVTAGGPATEKATIAQLVARVPYRVASAATYYQQGIDFHVTMTTADFLDLPAAPLLGESYEAKASSTGAGAVLRDAGAVLTIDGAATYTLGAYECVTLRYNGTEWEASRHGGGGSTPTGTGFVHVTGGVQDGAAALVQNADVGAAAAIALTKLGIGAANEVVTTNTGATAIQSRKIVDANVATGAAVAVTKLASGASGQNLRMASGVPSWNGECGGTEVSLAVGGTTVTALAVGANTLALVTGTGATTVQGIAAPSPAYAKRITVWNDTNATITFANENAGASASDRISTGNGSDDSLTIAGKRAEFIYSVAKARWGKTNYPP